MNIANDIARRLLAAERREEQRKLAELRARINAGPPAGSGISEKAWHDWNRYGFVVCPGGRRDEACTSADCKAGSRCLKMAALGQRGNGEAAPRKDRPTCGAKTRAGGSCAMRVEPGKKRCRLHGGKSTGPKTVEGRERIREAQRRRWGKLSKTPPAVDPSFELNQRKSDGTACEHGVADSRLAAFNSFAASWASAKG